MMLRREGPFINGVNSQDIVAFNYNLPLSSINAVITNVSSFNKHLSSPLILLELGKQ